MGFGGLDENQVLDLISAQLAGSPLLTNPRVATLLKMLAQAPQKYYDADNSNFIALQPPAVVNADVTLTLPVHPFSVLIGVDETQQSASRPNGETTVKTFALPANNYAKIVVIAVCRLSYSAGAYTGQYSVKLKIGATVKDYVIREGEPPASNFRITPLTITLSAAQQAAANIEVTISSGTVDASTILYVESLYVFGVTA